jgi:hypothetical protein
MKKSILLFFTTTSLLLQATTQSYPESYPWKGIVQDEATSGVVTLSDLSLNGHGRITTVKAGEMVQGTVNCTFDRDLCDKLALYRIVIGIHEMGPLTTIYNGFCLLTGKSTEQFSFQAPATSGFYQIRFRVSESFEEKEALDDWKDRDGNEPSSSTVIGILVVK